jgi:ligand-binding sensor domain-containing protein
MRHHLDENTCPMGPARENRARRWFTVSSVLAALLLLPAQLRAGEDAQSYRIDSWQGEHGLPQSSVTSIVQSREGYLWLGTFNGLARFDGVQFKVFNPNNAPGLSSGRIVQLFEDRRGNLWIATEEGSLIRYANGVFESVASLSQQHIPGYIQSLAQTGDGSLWLATSERRLLRFASGQLSDLGMDGALPEAGADGLSVGRDGQLWVSTSKGIAVSQGAGFETAFELNAGEKLERGVIITSPRGGCWVGMNGNLRRFDHGGWVNDFGAYPWPKGDLSCMLEDRQGQLWIGTYGSGLFRLTGNGPPLQVSTKDGLPGDLIRCICEDREGDLWIGTEGNGLARLKPALFRTYGRKQGLSGDCILAVCEGTEDELWIGTNGDGLNRLHHGVVKHFGAEQGLTNGFVWSVYQDRKGNVWAGTWGGGLFKLQGDLFSPVPDSGQANSVVCALQEDAGGRLWIGGQGSGPEIMRLNDGKPDMFLLKSPLPKPAIRAVVEDAAGNIWLGTHGDGLYRIQGEQQSHFGTNEGLSNEFIRSLYVDREGILWIGTYGGGLNRFESGRFTSFTTRDGLPSDALCYIAEDNRSNLWCASLGGVYCLKKEQLNRSAQNQHRSLRCLSYTTVDGLPSLECSGGFQPSGCKTRDGRLWFPTVLGLAVVDPEAASLNTNPPPVVIEEVVAEARTGTTVFDSSLFSKNTGATPGSSKPVARLAIAAGNQRLEFRYTGLSLVAPKKIRFEYKLDPLEEDWVAAGPRRTAYYSFLRPGDYQFRVRACNSDGVWNNEGGSLAITVLPRYWQTWWFRLLGGVAALLALLGIHEFRLASARKLAGMRLRIARDLHDEVGSNLGSIALLSEVIPKSPAAPVEEIAEVRRIALHTINSLRDIVWFLDPAADSTNDLVLRMKETARAMLYGIPFDFVSTAETGAATPSLELRRNILPIFKEILHNVVKHSRASHVDILLHASAREFKLRVSDNGIGFDPASVPAGNGLKNLRRRATELGGVLNLSSEPGKGSIVTLTGSIT